MCVDQKNCKSCEFDPNDIKRYDKILKPERMKSKRKVKTNLKKNNSTHKETE